MAVESFPPVEEADEHGLLALGGDLSIETLLLAYRSGIFPWPFDHRILAWFSPPKRALIEIANFHVPKSLERTKRRSSWTFTIDRAFADVIQGCARSRTGKRRGTWITRPMIQAYIELHQQGYAHSVECWDGESLVGGVYGVSIGKMFSAESMFYLKPNASKLSLWVLVEEVRKRGGSWIDCQVINPFTESVGAREIRRDEYLELLRSSIAKEPLFPACR